MSCAKFIQSCRQSDSNRGRMKRFRSWWLPRGHADSVGATPYTQHVATDLERRISEAALHLNMGAVVVVGAGMSLGARFPLTGGLNALVWDALDQNEVARRSLAARLGDADAPAKTLVGDDWSRTAAAWQVISAEPEARRRVQEQFAHLDGERASHPSPAHEALARLVHAGVVECVISLNWDTALESAYRRLFGVRMPSGLLFKPHGDASEPHAEWILPNEAGEVPDEVVEIVANLASGHARTLLVVGYSEQDQVVVDRLIHPLDTTWRAIRIGPQVAGPQDIPETAEIALPQLAAPYAQREDKSAWHPIPFRGSRGIRAALRGERLDPRDTQACPPLAEVTILVQALVTDCAVVLNGPTGGGKSISSYQALRQLAGQGFEILRLRDSARAIAPRVWLEDLRLFPRPKVLFIDDAQDLSPDTVRELCESANNDTRVLIAGIDHIAGGVRTVRLGASSAVARLADWVRNEKATLFPLILELDSHVGTHVDDPNFERRIELAANRATAWEFFYVLTGGWNRIRRQAVELRDDERADLALLALAVAQIAGVDAGVTRAKLAEFVGVLGRNSDWMERAIGVLSARRVVIEEEGRLRCTHLQSARNVLNWMLHPPRWDSGVPTGPTVPPIASAASNRASPPTPSVRLTPPPPLDVSRPDQDADREAACNLVAHALDSVETSLRGLSWLAGTSSIGGTRDILVWKQILGPARNEKLANRALSTPATGDIAAAATLLSDTLTYANSSAPLESFPESEERLQEWYGAIAPENAWALGDLVNTLRNRDAHYAETVIAYTKPGRLASLILKGGWPQSESTGHAVERLCCLGSQSFRQAVVDEMDGEAYAEMLRQPDPDFWRVVTLIGHIMSASLPLALSLFEQSGARLAEQFFRDPLQNWNSMFHLVLRLGYGAQFLGGGRRPPKESKVALRAFTRALDLDALAAMLSRPHELWEMYNLDVFIYMLDEADHKTLRAALCRADLVAFEDAVRSMKPITGTTLYAVLHLNTVRPDEIHEMLDRLEPNMDSLDPFIPYIAPDIAVRALERGAPLDLGLNHHHWGFAAEVMRKLADSDASVAAEVLQANSISLAVGLEARNYHSAWEGLRKFVPVCDRVAPGLLDQVIASLPETAVSGWDRALRRPARRHADIAPLVLRAARLGGHAGREAAILMRRFPSLNT